MTQADYDSILTAVDSNVVSSSEFYAHGSSVPDGNFAMAERGYYLATDTWVLGALLLLFGLLVFTIYRSRSFVLFQLHGLFSTERKFSVGVSSYKSFWVYASFVFISIAALSLSLSCFNYLQGRYSFSSALGIPYWLLAMGYVLFMCFIYLKAWLYVGVNWVFFDRDLAGSWMSGYFLLTSLLSLWFFPVAMVDLFTPVSGKVVLWCYLFAVILYEFLLILKLFVNFRAKKYGQLLIFLYFCSVELVPALILWHLLVWASDVFIEANVLY